MKLWLSPIQIWMKDMKPVILKAETLYILLMGDGLEREIR